MGAFAGAVGGMAVSGPSVKGGMGASMLAGGATQAQGIANEHVDAGKLDDAKKQHEEEQERNIGWTERVRVVFDSIDTCQDGKLQRNEICKAVNCKKIKKVFLENELLMSRAMFTRFFASLDRNNNGEVDFEEFKQAVRESDPLWHIAEDENGAEKDASSECATASESAGPVQQTAGAEASSEKNAKRSFLTLFGFNSRSNAVIDSGEGPSPGQTEIVEDSDKICFQTSDSFQAVPVVNQPVCPPTGPHATDEVSTTEDQEISEAAPSLANGVATSVTGDHVQSINVRVDSHSE